MGFNNLRQDFEKELEKKLELLVLKIKELVDTSNSKEEIKKDEIVRPRYKVKEFIITDIGYPFVTYESHSEKKEGWNTTIDSITRMLVETEEYTSVENLLNILEQHRKDNPFQVDIYHSFASFLWFEIFVCLENIENLFMIDEFASVYIIMFLKEIFDKPRNCNLSIALVNVKVFKAFEDEINEVKIKLREATSNDLKSDFQFDEISNIDVFSPYWTSPYTPPSAILQINYKIGNNKEILEKVLLSLTLLRLFRVGGTTYLYYGAQHGLTGYLRESNHKPIKSWQSLILKEEDIPKLKDFWEKMQNFIPKKIYSLDYIEGDELRNAYLRYYNTLFETEVEETAIVYAISGLESIFATGEGEKRYQLGMKIPKLLSYFGYDPLIVRKNIKEGNTIRNRFLHASAQKKKDNYQLKIALADYLRISILVILITKKKNELMNIIDESFFNEDKERELEDLIKKVKEVIGENNISC